MKKLIVKTALTATALALALMVALSLSGRWALPATANDGSDLVASPTATLTATLTATPTATPTSVSGGGSDLATSPTATLMATPTATPTSVSGGGSDLSTSPSATPTATPTAVSGGGSVTGSTCESPTPNPGAHDYDCDGLIEIATFAQLNAIRYDTAKGNVGIPDPGNEDAYRAVFGQQPNQKCPISTDDNKPVCTGYELVADIQMTGNWTPIGGWAATLEGNGHVISGMVVNVTAGRGGMFSGVGGKIRNLGLRDADVTLNTSGAAGILAGGNGGEIKTSYATGKITYAGVARGADADYRGVRADVGGLVGRNNGTIIASWADVDILLDTEGARAGGLVGSQKGFGRYAEANPAKIVGSVAYGDIKVSTLGFGRVGGFIGMNMNLNENNGKTTDIRESYAYGKVIPDEDVSWGNSNPKTKTGVFGCNSGNLVNVYYNDVSEEGGCSPLGGRTSP